MRIAYLSTSVIPSSQANSIHVMHMCDAFVQNRHQVSLFCREGKTGSKDSVHRFYGVGEGFDLVNRAWPHIPCGGVFYGAGVFRTLRKRRADIDLLYARCLYSAYFARNLGTPIVFESHALPRTWLHRRLLTSILSSKHLCGLVLISLALQKDYEAAFPSLCRRARVIVMPDAAVAPRETADASEPPMRTNPGGPLRIVYTGSLLPGKGADTVVALARRYPGFHFHIFGGSSVASAVARDLPANLFCHGFLPPAEMRRWQAGADILLLPNQRKVLSDKCRVDIGRWTSPLKMFEYMASGVPLIASDMPVLREVLVPEHNCLLAAPDDIDAWGRAIQRLAGDPELRQMLAARARAEVIQKYNWPARARDILDRLVSCRA